MNLFPRSNVSSLTRLGWLVCYLGVASTLLPARGSETREQVAYLNGGYFLLHQLCEDEAKLPMIFLIKDAPPEIEAFAKQASQTAQESLATLDRMQEHDPNLKFNRNPLPRVEIDVRDSIQDEKQHQLVFGTSGPEFVRALVVTQIQSSSYALNLAKVLAQRETNPERVKALERITAKWHKINQEAFQLLRN